MKKLTVLFVLLLSVLLSLPVMAAPLGNDQFTVIPAFDFTGLTDGTTVQQQGGYVFYGLDVTTATVQGEKFVITGSDETQIFVTRFAMPEEITKDQAKDMQYLGYYVENNTANPIGVNVMAESKGGGNSKNYIQDENGNDTTELAEAVHQMMYADGVYPEDIVCYLVDMDGKVTKPGAYQVDEDDNALGLAEIPAGFKGYYLVSLTQGGFNQCLYGSWGDHPEFDCEGGKWTPGEFGLVNMGFGFRGAIADGENVVIDDLFMAAATDKFQAPDPSTDLTTPTAPAETTQVTATTAATATAAASAAKTTETTDNGSSLWLYVGIAAAIVVAGGAAAFIIIKGKKKKAE